MPSLNASVMREEQKIHLAGTGAAIATSVAVAAQQAGHFGSGVFSYQVTAAIAGASCVPYLYHSEAYTAISRFILVPFFLAWLGAAFVPAFYAFALNLFSGHRVPDAKWYHAVWRIYAILFIWICFAVLNERIIRPWWRKNSDKYLARFRKHSVATQARQIALDRRTKALEGIKARVVTLLVRKKLTERKIEERKREIEKAQENIKKSENLVKRAKERAAQCYECDRKDAEEQVEMMSDMLESARSHERGVHAEIARCELDLTEVTGKMEPLQHEWTEALHIQNHAGFFR